MQLPNGVQKPALSGLSAGFSSSFRGARNLHTLMFSSVMRSSPEYTAIADLTTSTWQSRSERKPYSPSTRCTRVQDAPRLLMQNETCAGETSASRVIARCIERSKGVASRVGGGTRRIPRAREASVDGSGGSAETQETHLQRSMLKNRAV